MVGDVLWVYGIEAPAHFRFRFRLGVEPVWREAPIREARRKQPKKKEYTTCFRTTDHAAVSSIATPTADNSIHPIHSSCPPAALWRLTTSAITLLGYAHDAKGTACGWFCVAYVMKPPRSPRTPKPNRHSCINPPSPKFGCRTCPLHH
jgi:hypothetical protein